MIQAMLRKLFVSEIIFLFLIPVFFVWFPDTGLPMAECFVTLFLGTLITAFLGLWTS